MLTRDLPHQEAPDHALIVGSNPALAGKPAAALVKALQDFKTGTKPSLMHGLAASLSAQDIENLAAYYASLK